MNNLKNRIEFDTCQKLVVKLNDLYICAELSSYYFIEHGYNENGDHVTNLFTNGSNAFGDEIYYITETFKTYGDLHSYLMDRINNF